MATTINKSNIGAGGALNLIPVKVMGIILDTNHELAEKKGGYDALGTIFYLTVSECINDPKLEHPETGEKVNNMKTAKPLFSNQRFFPLKGEVVLLLSGTGRDIDKDLRQAYYLPNTNIWNSTHHNSIPNVDAYSDKATKDDYKETQGGLVRQVEDGSTDIPLGNYFNEKLNTKSLLPYEGDFLLEGRFGNSIRFGSTAISDFIPNTSKNNWSSTGVVGDPIIIIRNGQDPEMDNQGWVPTIENINRDPSSIYLTSNQKIDNLQVASPYWASWKANIEQPTDEVGQLVDTEVKIAETDTGNQEENDKIISQELQQINASDDEFDETAWGSEGPDPPTVSVATTAEEEMSMLDELMESGDFEEEDFEEVLLPSELGVEFTEQITDPNTGQTKDIDIEITNVTKSGNIAVPLLAQGDAKWKDQVTYYNGGKYVIGPVGCCLLSCCMIASYYKGKIITPYDAAGSGGYTNSTSDNTPNGTGALLEWGQMEKTMGKKKKFHFKGSNPSSKQVLDLLISSLDAGNPVLWEKKQSGRKRTSYSSDPNADACEYIKAYGTSNQASPTQKKYVWGTQHWMVVVGYNASADANSNPTFQVNDPSGAAFRPTVPLEHLVNTLGRFVTWS
tara:strand:- start:1599 stop:3455 length:1857 start_codon:yes stop_codon:yes gene_type:complete